MKSGLGGFSENALGHRHALFGYSGHVPEQLKPGKTAELKIRVDDRREVLMIPVQCVVQQGTNFYAWVRLPEGVQRRELLLGTKNDTSIEIVDGLKKGERVLLTPRAESLTTPENQ